MRLEKSEPLRITATPSKAALDFVHEGKAHAIGEVGRPHWPVSDEIWELSNDLLDETMHLAAQEGLPLQLHVEGESEETYPDLARRALRQGMDLQQLVRHYSPPDVREEHTHGLTPSVLCGKVPWNDCLRPIAWLKPVFSSKPITWTILAGPVLFWGQKPSRSEPSNSSLQVLTRRSCGTHTAPFHPRSTAIESRSLQSPWFDDISHHIDERESTGTSVRAMLSARRWGMIVMALMLCSFAPLASAHRCQRPRGRNRLRRKAT